MGLTTLPIMSAATAVLPQTINTCRVATTAVAAAAAVVETTATNDEKARVTQSMSHACSDDEETRLHSHVSATESL